MLNKKKSNDVEQGATRKATSRGSTTLSKEHQEE
jgi:hypothetical protein